MERVIPISHSDRPDAIISPCTKERNIKRFLSNQDLKILVETTAIGCLDKNKVEMDLNNFVAHTTKVLKINGHATLIIGNSLARNLSTEIAKIKKIYKQPFTITTTCVLEKIRDLCAKNRTRDWRLVSKFLTYYGILDEEVFSRMVAKGKLPFSEN